MAWQVPRDLLLSAPQLAQPWDESSEQTEGEREVREVLEGLQVRKGRAVLMAKKEEHERLRGKLDWQQEPVYGTPYLVEKFDEDLIVEVRHDSRESSAGS